MNKEKKVKTITAGLVFSWIFGIIFLLIGIAVIGQGSLFIGILIMLFSIMIIPLFNKLVAEKFKFKISGGLKWVFVIIILVLMGIAISQAPNNNTVTSKQNAPDNLDSKATETTQTQTYGLGDSITAGDFTWKITKVSTTQEIGEDVMGTFVGKKASGTFIILDVEVENTGKEAKYLSDSDIKLVDDQNREFSADTVAAIYLKPDGSALVFEQVNPGIKKQGKIVYDVPEDLKVVNVKILSTLFSSETYNVKIDI